MADAVQAVRANPRDTNALYALYEENIGILRKVANRYGAILARRGDVDAQDLTQAGFFGLIAAAKTYDDQRGKTWAGWALWYVERAVRNALGARNTVNEQGERRSTFPPPSVYLDEPLPGADETGGEATRLDLLEDDSLPDPSGALMLEDMRRAVRDAVDALPGDQAAVVRAHRLEGRSLAAMAREAGRPVWTLQNTEQGALRRLRMTLKKTAGEYGLDQRTNFYRYKGVSAFQRDGTSTTEAAALWRIEQREALPRGRDACI